MNKMQLLYATSEPEAATSAKRSYAPKALNKTNVDISQVGISHARHMMML